MRMMLSDGKLRFNGPGFEVNIHQGIQFVQYNIDIVGANAGGNNRNPFFPDNRYGSQIHGAAFEFNRIEVFAYAVDPFGIATVIMVVAISSGLTSRW